MEVGELSDKACETIRQRLFKEGMKCTKSQIRYKWDEVKRLHSFYHNKVLGAKVEVKDEKFWKRILKSRISKKEYKDLIHGPPKDLEHLDFIFGNKIAVESYEKENQERESAESSRDVLTVDLERVTHDAKRFSEQLKMAEDTNKRLQECNSSLQQQNSNLQADASKSGETISKLQKEKSAMMETMAIMRESNSSMGNQLESYRIVQAPRMINEFSPLRTSLSTQFSTFLHQSFRAVSDGCGARTERPA
ncbi:kinesin-like protein KIN-14C [Miscanthus floridulus]|uniref:kinesin-like protein KIN-14C n=1 Tax=Miscanthus floridulus TaxID=154761 RepID=UPI003459461E